MEETPRSLCSNLLPMAVLALRSDAVAQGSAQFGLETLHGQIWHNFSGQAVPLVGSLPSESFSLYPIQTSHLNSFQLLCLIIPSCSAVKSLVATSRWPPCRHRQDAAAFLLQAEQTQLDHAITAIAWDSYGPQPGDTCDVAVWLF